MSDIIPRHINKVVSSKNEANWVGNAFAHWFPSKTTGYRDRGGSQKSDNLRYNTLFRRKKWLIHQADSSMKYKKVLKICIQMFQVLFFVFVISCKILYKNSFNISLYLLQTYKNKNEKYWVPWEIIKRKLLRRSVCISFIDWFVSVVSVSKNWCKRSSFVRLLIIRRTRTRLRIVDYWISKKSFENHAPLRILKLPTALMTHV